MRFVTDYTVREVCAALDADRNPASGWVTGPKPGDVRRELWLEDAKMWVRSHGRLVTGWREEWFSSAWFGPISAFRIRRAVRRWAARHGKVP